MNFFSKVWLRAAAFLCFVAFSDQLFAQAELWGVTSEGGNENAGVIFKTDESGNNYQVVYHFGYLNPGSTPHSARFVKASNGKLYNILYSGGKYDKGVIFEYTPSTNSYVVLVDLSDSLGAWPEGSLTIASDGNLYGTTQNGGKHSRGVLFQYDLSTKKYTKKFDFNDTLGNGPSGKLVETNGKLYGTTQAGGQNKVGTIFEYDLTTATLTVKKHFDASSTASTGNYPFGSLMLASNGKLYGTAASGGAYSSGVLFEFDPSTGTFTKKHDFTSTLGGSPYGGLVEVSTGKLYGIGGIIYEYDISTSTFTKKLSLDLSSVDGYGATLEKASNGKLYATLRNYPNGQGAVIEYDPSANTLKKIKEYDNVWNNGYVQRAHDLFDDGGVLYGMADGGLGMSGILFTYDLSAGTYTKKLNLKDPVNGIKPNGTLMRAANGKLYGTTVNGGNSDRGLYGTLFEYDITSGTYTKKVDFDQTVRGAYYGAYANYNGNLYSVSGNQLYEYNTSTGAYNKKGSPVSANNNFSSLVKAGNGKYYGLSQSNGANNVGFVFEVDPDAGTITNMASFSSSGMRVPMGELAVSEGGTLYGIATQGGSSGYGGIFSYSPGSGSIGELVSFDGSIMRGGPGGLAEARNGKLYGTVYGVNTNYNVFFEYDPSSGSLTKKSELHFGVFGNPLAASNGKIYGLVRSGGTKGWGYMYEYDPATATLTTKYNFNVVDGKYPMYTSLIEVCHTPALGTITGNSTMCGDGTNTTYSVPTVTGAVSYKWEVKGGGAITSGQGTNSVNISFSNSGKVTISVRAVNECEGPASTFDVTVMPSKIIWKSIKANTTYTIGKTMRVSLGDVSPTCHKALYITTDGQNFTLIKDNLTATDTGFDWRVADYEGAGKAFFKVTGQNMGKEWVSPVFNISTPLPYKAIDFVGEYNTIKPNAANPQNAAEPGYPLRFKLQIANEKPINLLTLKGILKSNDPYISIIDSTGTYNNIIAGKKGWSVDEYEIYIKPTCPDNHVLVFDLKVTDEIDAEDPWTSRQHISFPVNVMDIPVIVIDDDQIPDSKGDDDDVAEKDEVIEILPLLRNKSDYTFNEPKGTLTSFDTYIDIWNNKAGATGTVYNTYKYNSAGGNHQPLLPKATNITPEEDYVFDYLADNAYSLDFRMLLDCYLTEFKIEDPNGGGMVAPKIRYGLPYGLNKGYPKPISVDITEPVDGSDHTIGDIISIKATISSSVALDSVKLYINDVLKNDNKQTAYTYDWNTTGLTAGSYIIKVEAVDISKNRAVDVIVVTLDEESGISLYKGTASNVSLYPNPGRGIFTLQHNGGTVKATGYIVDLSGKEIHSFGINSNGATTVDASFLEDGYYIIRVVDTNGAQSVCKLIIQNSK